MKKKSHSHWSLLVLGLCCAFTLSGCKDSDFDFDNIDTLLGLGGEELALPGNNSTRNIMLDDFLELNNSDFVHIADNGDYELNIDDGNVHTASATVEMIRINDPSITEGSIPLAPGTGSGLLTIFDYSNRSVSADIVDLQEMSTNVVIVLNINIPSTVRRIQNMVITMPDYLTLNNATIDGNTVPIAAGNNIQLGTVPTGSHRLSVNVSKFTVGQPANDLGSATFDASAHTVSMKGRISANITLTQSDFTSEGLSQALAGNISYIRSECSLTELVANSARGRFSSAMDFGNLGEVSLNNVPNFLTDNDVNMELYDPHIDLRVSNNAPMGGLVSGTLKSLDASGNVMASVAVPQFTLLPGTSVVRLCKQNNVYGGDTVAVIVPTLTDLITKIPSRIEFNDIHAQCDPSQTATIDLGRDYNVDVRYGFNCPLQFDDDATIVYTDSMDGWNDGVKDLMFREVDGQVDGYLQVQADIENTIPMYLTVTANAMDIDGNDISQNDMQVTVDKTIAASADGVTPAATTVTIRMQPMNNQVFKRLDGLRLHLTGSAKDADGVNAVTGKTLNAYKQGLKATSIRGTKHGKVVFDAN